MKSSTGTGTGRFSPLKDAHDRIKAEAIEQKDAVVKQRHAAARREFSSAALEVADKSHGMKLLSTKDRQRSETTASQDQPQKQPQRERPMPRPSYALHGLGPGGTVTHTVSGRMRAVRVQSEPSSTANGPTGSARQTSPLREAAERLFEKKAEKPRAAQEKAATEKDGGDGVER